MSTMTMTASRGSDSGLTFLQALLKWESVTFALICIADLLSTLYLVHAGTAGEANPILNHFLKNSVASFCTAKIISFVPMLLLAAWYRTVNPVFIQNALRCGVIAYIAIYVIGVAGQFV